MSEGGGDFRQPGQDWLHEKAILWVSYCQNLTCFSPDGMSVITHWNAQKKERREAEQCQGKKRNTLKMPKIYGYLLLLPYLWDCNMASNYFLSEKFQ